MKRIVLFIFLVLSIFSIQAQQIYFEAGLTNAAFDNYKNDEGVNTLNNQYSKTLKPSFGAGILIPIFNTQKDNQDLGEKINWDSGIKYNKYLINTSVNNGSNGNIPIQYNLTFLTLKTGLNISFLNYYKLKFHVHGHFSHDWLLYGSQTYQDQFIDLKKNSEFYQTLFNYHFGGGLEYTYTDQISFIFDYDFKKSFKKNNPQKNNEEYYQIYSNSFSFGIRLTFNNKI